MTLLRVKPDDVVSPDDAGATVSRLIDANDIDPIDHLAEDDAGDGISRILENYDVSVVEHVDLVESITEMHDDPDTTYIWTLKEGTGGDDMAALSDRIHEAFDGEPRALHLFLTNVDDLEEYSYEELEHEVLPWLVQAKKRNGDL